MTPYGNKLTHKLGTGCAKLHNPRAGISSLETHAGRSNREHQGWLTGCMLNRHLGSALREAF